MADLAKSLEEIGSIDQASDPNIGSAIGTSGSLVTLVTTVVPSLCIALTVWLFVCLSRDRIPKLYAVKSLRGNEGGEPVSWISEFYRARDVDLISHKSLDSYLLLRYLRMCILICLGGCATLCAVLLPLNATGRGGMSQLDRLTIANIKGGSPRTYAHACCTSVYFGWVMFILARERLFYIELRHALFVSSIQANRSKSRTGLFTDVPKGMQDVKTIRQSFGNQKRLKVWLATATKSLRQDTQRQEALEDRLDTIRSRQSRRFVHESSLESGNISPVPGSSNNGSFSRAPTFIANEPEMEFEVRKKMRKLQIEKKRMLHQSFSLRYSSGSQEFAHDSARQSPLSLLPSIFVRFSTVRGAQLAFRSRHHSRLSKFTPRCIDTAANEIIWANLGLDWKSRLWRRLLSQLAILALIIFWSFPVAFATALTNVDVLLPSVRWRERSPELIQNAVDGLLPSLVLSLLMALPPMIISLLGRFSGLVSRAEVENYLNSYYFWFRVVQVFLVAALGSTASSVLIQIYSYPSSVTTILAKRLPGASNFYFSYLVVQGFSESAFVLLNLGGIFSRCILSRMLDDTPRKKDRRQRGTFETSLGTVLANCSSLLIIALCYAPAAPLMLCFATVAFTIFYIAHRYNIFFTTDPVADTKGKLHVSALKHTLVGLYLGELFLVGLLTITAINGQRVSGPLVISCVLLVSTAFYQRKTEDVFRPWEARVPYNNVILESRTWESRGKWQKRLGLNTRWWSSSIWIFLDSWSVVKEKLAEDCSATSSNCGTANVKVEQEEYLGPEVIGPDVRRVLLG